MALLSDITTAVGFMPAGAVLPFAGVAAPSGWLLCDGTEKAITSYANLYSTFSFALSTTTNSTVNVTVSSTADLCVGATITAASGIPAGAYITSITNATTFVISAAATTSTTQSATYVLYNRQVNPTTGAAYAAPSAGNFRVPDYRGVFLRGAGTASGQTACRVGGYQTQGTAPNALQNAASSVTGATLGDGSHSHTTTLNNRAGNSAFTDRGPAWGSDDWLGAAVAASTTTVLNHIHAAGTLAAAAQGLSSTDLETRPLNRGVNYIIKI